eukprot:1240766-Karenia_brevis.AAC.1
MQMHTHSIVEMRRRDVHESHSKLPRATKAAIGRNIGHRSNGTEINEVLGAAKDFRCTDRVRANVAELRAETSNIWTRHGNGDAWYQHGSIWTKHGNVRYQLGSLWINILVKKFGPERFGGVDFAYGLELPRVPRRITICNGCGGQLRQT